jgi:hypothetical protein
MRVLVVSECRDKILGCHGAHFVLGGQLGMMSQVQWHMVVTVAFNVLNRVGIFLFYLNREVALQPARGGADVHKCPTQTPADMQQACIQPSIACMCLGQPVTPTSATSISSQWAMMMANSTAQVTASEVDAAQPMSSTTACKRLVRLSSSRYIRQLNPPQADKRLAKVCMWWATRSYRVIDMMWKLLEQGEVYMCNLRFQSRQGTAPTSY